MGVLAGLRAQFCECAMRGSLAPHPTRLSSQSTKWGSTCSATVLNTSAFGPATRIHQFEGPILRMRNARQSAAASRSAPVSKH